MVEQIRSLAQYPTTLSTLVVGHLRISAYSKTEYPSIEEKLVDNEEIQLPLSTYENGVYICVNRGASLSRQIEGGVKAYVTKDLMTRAPVIRTKDIGQALSIKEFLKKEYNELKKLVESTTKYGKILSIKPHHVGRDVYIRLAMQCGDASGHNMTTKAGTELVKYLVERFPGSKYISVSGNLCTDKKAAGLNATSGRGKSVITEITIPGALCIERLKTTPEVIIELNTIKNLQGGVAAGTLHSANAHYANPVAAMYISTGQDIANIVEGSFGITQTSIESNGDLYFSATMPCLIVGTVGNGKTGESQRRSLEILGCSKEGKPSGYNSQRLAAIIAGATTMAELSLLADQTVPGKLIKAHERFER